MIARAASGLVLCVLVWAAAPPLQAQEANRILPQLRLSHYPERSPSIPSDFTYGGKPIEAVCIEKLVGDESRSPSLQSCPRPVNILDCLLSENHDNDAWWDLRGYRGYCHMATEEGPGGSYSVQHNIIYKYLGKFEGHQAVLTEWGTGTSSSRSIEDSSEVPQVWRLRSEGSWTSHNGSSVNFLGDGTIFWGDGN